MRYALDLRFNVRPATYWWYYDPAGSRLVIDCYGGHIGKPEKVDLSRASPFRGVRVTNRSTNMSLGGKQALIEITADPGWRLQAAPAPDNVIRVTADKPLSPPRPKSRRRYLIPLVATGAGVVVAMAVLLIVGRS